MTRTWILVVFLVLWTIALLVPIPNQGVDVGPTIPDLKFYVSKVVHVLGYAFLTVLIITLPARPITRLAWFGFLSVHAFLSEYSQAWTSYRTGSLRDVLLDHLGMLIGLGIAAIYLRWARRRLAPTQA